MVTGTGEWFYGRSALLLAFKWAIVITVFASLQMACGGDDVAVEEDGGPLCEDLFEGSFETNHEWAESQAVAHVDFLVDGREEEIVLTPRSADGEAIGEMTLSAGGSIESGGMELTMAYEPTSGEAVYIHSEMGYYRSGPGEPLSTESRFYQYNIIESGEKSLGFMIVGQLDSAFSLPKMDEDNPLWDVEEFSIITHPRDFNRRAVLHAVSEGELIVGEEEIESWGDEFIQHDDWFDEASLESIFTVLMEENLFEQIAEIQQTCEASHRSGHSRAQSPLTVCEFADSLETVLDFYGNVFLSFFCGSLTWGLCPVIFIAITGEPTPAGIIGGAWVERRRG